MVIPPLAPDGPIVTILDSPARDNAAGDGAFRSIGRHCGAFWNGRCLRARTWWWRAVRAAGKTTLLNALSCCIPAGERIVTIEDTAELRFLEHPHVVRLEARPRNRGRAR